MLGPTPDMDRASIRAALSGDENALRRIVDLLAPVVQARVARALARRGAEQRPRLRHELEDYTQEAFAELFSAGGRALASWDPNAGRSLQNYVGQRVEWFMASRLRNAQLPLMAAEVAAGPAAIEQRDSVRHVLAGIERKWSQFGVRLFYLLFVLQAPSKEVGAELGLSCDAVDQWRFRLREFARGLLLEDDSP